MNGWVIPLLPNFDHNTTTTPSPPPPPPTQLPLPSFLPCSCSRTHKADPHAPLPQTHQVRHPNHSQLPCIRGMGKSSGPMYGSVRFTVSVRGSVPTLHRKSHDPSVCARATQGNLFPYRRTPTLHIDGNLPGPGRRRPLYVTWGTVLYQQRYIGDRKHHSYLSRPSRHISQITSALLKMQQGSSG